MTDAVRDAVPEGAPWITEDFPRPEQSIVERAGAYRTAELSDGMNRFNAMHHAIKPLGPGMALAGPALTVRLRAADNLFLIKAALMAQPGDVLVVDVGGDCSNAVMGDVIARLARARGIAGIVVDGAVRDLASCLDVGLPVFARCITPAGPDKDGPGHINGAIACGGLSVRPGDIIVGDDDGVVVLPQGSVLSICARAEAKAEHDRQLLQALSVGSAIFEWVDPLLRQRGYLPVDSNG